MATTKKEVQKTDEKPQVPAAYDYGEEAGAGFENKSGSDLSIPFINLLQSNSPEVQESRDGSVRMGMMKNSVTGELYDGETGFGFQPVHDETAFVEWVPRNRGGGFVALHAPDSPEVKKAIEENGGRIPRKGSDGKKIPLKIDKEGGQQNELVETYYVYGKILDDAGEETNGFAVIAFTSTKIKVYRDWVTSMIMLKGRPPMYANRARIKSHVTKNEEGTFANYVIEPLVGKNWTESLIPPGNPVLEEGKDFRKMVVTGLARANFEEQQPANAGGDGDPTSDETPF